MSRAQAIQTISNRASAGDLRNEADAIAKHIHYPECWDTAAYPTLKDAIMEIVYSAGCNPEDCTKLNEEVIEGGCGANKQKA